MNHGEIWFFVIWWSALAGAHAYLGYSWYTKLHAKSQAITQGVLAAFWVAMAILWATLL